MKRSSHSVWGLGLVAAATFVSGCFDCDLACREVPLVLELPPALTAGSWEFEVEADARIVRCEAELPPTGQGVCSSDVVRLRLDADARQAESAGRFEFRSRPKRVRVAASRDGEPVADVTVEPAYEMVYPDHPDCAGALCATTRLDFVPDDA